MVCCRQRFKIVDLERENWSVQKNITEINGKIFFPDIYTFVFSPPLSYLPSGRCCSVTESRMTLLRLPWTVAHQDSLSMGFPRQEFWSGLPFPSPRDLPNPRDSTYICTGRQILYHWVTREVHVKMLFILNLCNLTYSKFKIFSELVILTTKESSDSKSETCQSQYVMDAFYFEKCWAGWSTSWNQDCWEKYQ